MIFRHAGCFDGANIHSIYYPIVPNKQDASDMCSNTIIVRLGESALNSYCNQVSPLVRLLENRQ